MTVGAVVVLWLLASVAEAAAPASDLPADARAHNERGVALIHAGQYDAGIAELERAYADMPDPLEYRTGRGKVLGSLRSALQRRYTETGDAVHLCRLRELLRGHRNALLAALGPAGHVDDVSGTDEAIRELEATLGGRSCGEPAEPVPTSKLPPPAAPPSRAPTKSRRGLRIAGGVLMGAGFASLGVATFGFIAMADNRSKLQDLTESVEAAGRPPTYAQNLEAGGYFERAYERRSLGIVTGVLGGAAVLTGMALRVAGKRRAEAQVQVHVTPTAGPGFAGAVGSLAF